MKSTKYDILVLLFFAMSVILPLISCNPDSEPDFGPEVISILNDTSRCISLGFSYYCDGNYELDLDQDGELDVRFSISRTISPDGNWTSHSGRIYILNNDMSILSSIILDTFCIDTLITPNGYSLYNETICSGTNSYSSIEQNSYPLFLFENELESFPSDQFETESIRIYYKINDDTGSEFRRNYSVGIIDEITNPVYFVFSKESDINQSEYFGLKLKMDYGRMYFFEVIKFK